LTRHESVEFVKYEIRDTERLAFPLRS